MNNIPKHLHLYWCGKQPMSWLQSLTAMTFHDLNPDWSITVYTPIQKYTGKIKFGNLYTREDCFHNLLDLDYIKVENVDMEDRGIDLSYHDAVRSDILRYQLLHDIGGVWSDFDVLWLKPISNMLTIEVRGNCSMEEAQSILSYTKWVNGGQTVGILMQSPGNPLIKAVVEETKKKLDKVGYQDYGARLLERTLGDLKKAGMYPGVVGVPYKTYYTFSPLQPHKANIVYNLDDLFLNKVPLNFVDDPEVMCIHWYNSHKLSKRFVNSTKWDECTMTLLLNKLGYKE